VCTAKQSWFLFGRRQVSDCDNWYVLEQTSLEITMELNPNESLFFYLLTLHTKNWKHTKQFVRPFLFNTLKTNPTLLLLLLFTSLPFPMLCEFHVDRLLSLGIAIPMKVCMFRWIQTHSSSLLKSNFHPWICCSSIAGILFELEAIPHYFSSLRPRN